MERLDPRADFLRAATWHGTLETAAAILAAHPEIASGDIYTAALLGDAAAVQRFLALDPASSTAQAGPRGWDALTYLCFSKYLRLERARSDGFVRAARALLDAGASANTGWYEMNHLPSREWESALYGAAGVAHHAELTRLLLERGADPNDEEVPYHAPETHDNAALKILVESGKLNPDSLGTILLRKTDWHDYEGIKWLLERGVDPNRRTRWGKTALHNAVLSDNALDIIEVLLDHGPARAKAPRRLPRPDQERNLPHPPRAGEQRHHRAVAAGARGASAHGGGRAATCGAAASTAPRPPSGRERSRSPLSTSHCPS